MTLRPWIELAINYGPLGVFLGLFLHSGLMAATLGLVLATILVLPVQWKLEGKIPKLPLIMTGFLLLMGGLTLWLNDPQFIKMRPTIVNSLLALVFGYAALMRKNWLCRWFGEKLPLSEQGWRVLGVRLPLLFITIALANELVWRFASDSQWVSFKLMGIPTLWIVFLLAHARFVQQPETQAPTPSHEADSR
jgi:intracellular septation protein